MLSRRIAIAGIGSVIKAAWVFLLFVFAARELELDQFADFSFWLTVSIVSGLFFDFGQQTALLTRLSRTNKGSNSYLQRKLGFALVLLLALIVVGSSASLFLDVNAKFFCYLLVAISAAFAGSVGILYCIPHRSRQDYSADIRVGVAESAAVLFGCALLNAQSVSTGLGVLAVYGVARLCGALSAAASSDVGMGGLLRPRLPNLVLMRHWHPYFLHLLFGTLILNIDLLISRFVLDTADYALYQTGMRLVYAANLILTVVSNIYIPSWTRSDLNFGFKFTNKQFLKVIAVILGASIVGMGAIYLSGDRLPVLIFGEGFRGLGAYLPLFGLLIALRLGGAFVGVLLSCRYAQEYRTIASLLGVVLLTMLLVPWLGSYTIQYVILVQLATHLVMDFFLLYGLNQNWKSSVV